MHFIEIIDIKDDCIFQEWILKILKIISFFSFFSISNYLKEFYFQTIYR